MPFVPIDVKIFKAINPRWNISVTEARELAARLVRMGFPSPVIVCHPQGDGMGWGSTQEHTLDDLARAGVAATEPINLLFRFSDRSDRQLCAQIVEDFNHGVMVGYERLYGVLNEQAQQGDWLKQLTRIPAIWNAITSVVTGLLSDDAPPTTARPPITFFSGPAAPAVEAGTVESATE